MSTDTLEYTAGVDGTIVPLSVIRDYYGVSQDTIERWVRADKVETVDLPSDDGPGREKGIRWAVLVTIPKHKKRWRK